MYKSQLQNYAQKRNLKLLQELIQKEWKVYTGQESKTKKQAEMSAAKVA